MPPTILFDLDGTLINSVELILSSYRHTLTIHRGHSPGDDAWLAGLGTPLWTQFRQFTEDEREVEAMVVTYREHNLAHHDAMVRPYPGVREAVAGLRTHARLGIVTSKSRAGTLRGLGLFRMADWFEVVVAADDVERHKPDPTPVLRALELLGAKAHDTVFVGDSPHDLAAGRAAGVRTGAVLWGPFPRTQLAAHEPDYWFAEPGGLRELVEPVAGD